MNRICYSTIPTETNIYTDNENGINYLYIEHNNVIIARFTIDLFWDMLKDNISKMDSFGSSGMERRIYEASNVYRLTNEYLDSKE